jgi:hypothetical protein
MIDAADAKNDTLPYTVDGADFVCVQPALPVTTPGDYLMFALTGGHVTWANMSNFVLSGSETIAIAARAASVRIDPASNMESKPQGLGLKSGYGLYPDGDKNKLAALPTNAALGIAFDTKVDKVAGLQLSQNSYTDAEKTKLGALPNNAELQGQYVQTGAVNQTVGGIKTFGTAPVIPAKTDLSSPSSTQPATEGQLNEARKWENITNKPVLLVNDRRLVQLTKSGGSGVYDFTAATLGDATYLLLLHKPSAVTELVAQVTIPLAMLGTTASCWQMPVHQINSADNASMFAYMTIKAEKYANGDVHLWTDDSNITRKSPGAASWSYAALGGNWVTHIYCDKTTSGVQTADLPLKAANGGTGLTTIPANRIMLGNGTGNVASIDAGTARQILRSNGSGAPLWVNSADEFRGDSQNSSANVTYHQLFQITTAWAYRQVFVLPLVIDCGEGWMNCDLILYGNHDAATNTSLTEVKKSGYVYGGTALGGLAVGVTSGGVVWLRVTGLTWHNVYKGVARGTKNAYLPASLGQEAVPTISGSWINVA